MKIEKKNWVRTNFYSFFCLLFCKCSYYYIDKYILK
jgi:hypothetical protein